MVGLPLKSPSGELGAAAKADLTVPGHLEALRELSDLAKATHAPGRMLVTDLTVTSHAAADRRE